ncbi:MAG: type II toxin-antitoxin system mRNA interferase toxin, RelE/StbE family [Patescibacteria group bacterium]
MQIDFANQFDKQLKKSPNKIKIAFQKRLALFIKDKYHPLLDNHQLTGKLKLCRSINVTGDWRALFKELNSGEIVFFVVLGTHSHLYK